MIESVCTDPETVERNIRHCKLGTPDYVGIPVDEATRDFRARVAAYESTYETIDARLRRRRREEPVLDQDRRLSTVRDQQRARVSSFSVDPVPESPTHGAARVLSERHGQSEYNVLGKIGGDSGLSPLGDAYAKALARFCRDEVTKGEKGERPARLWTSTLRRTRETARYISHHSITIDYDQDDVDHAQEWVQLRPVAWSNLDELFAGVCDGHDL